MIVRMIRATLLDVNLYREVERNAGLNGEALRVVIIVSALSGIGTALGSLLSLQGLPIGGFFRGIVEAVIFWGVWSFAIYVVGVRLFNGSATFGELLRTLAYAYSPSALLVVRFLPLLGGVLFVVGVAWTLLAGLVAVREALDLDFSRAAGAIAVAAVAVFVVRWVLSLVF